MPTLFDCKYCHIWTACDNRVGISFKGSHNMYDLAKFQYYHCECFYYASGMSFEDFKKKYNKTDCYSSEFARVWKGDWSDFTG